MANKSQTTYIGVTGNLRKRVYEHKSREIDSFTKKYWITKLVYVESYSDIKDAIKREKELKKWRREKKIKLIEILNPSWNDLSD